MIVCPPSHSCVDIVIPVCFKGNVLSRNNMTAILIQVLNGKRFPRQIPRNLFRGMDPFDAGLFIDEDEPLPIIRMVFELTSPMHGITFAQPPCETGYTAYDIRCAGLKPDTFACIEDDLPSYVQLLEWSRSRCTTTLLTGTDLCIILGTEKSECDAITPFRNLAH
jgi:hypothetical protein